MRTKTKKRFAAILSAFLCVMYVVFPFSAHAATSLQTAAGIKTAKTVGDNGRPEFPSNGETKSLSFASVDSKKKMDSSLSAITDYPIVVFPTYNNYLVPFGDNALFWEVFYAPHGMGGTAASSYLYTDDDYFMSWNEYELYLDLVEIEGSYYTILGVIPTSSYPVSSFYSLLGTTLGGTYTDSFSALIPNIGSCTTSSQCIVANDMAPHGINSSTSEISPTGNGTVNHDGSAITEISGYYEAIFVPYGGSISYAMSNNASLNSTTNTVNAESGPFYQDGAGSFLTELKGGTWEIYSMWVDAASMSSPTDTSGFGFSISGDGLAHTRVLMDASGSYSGVWNDEITITGNGFGEVGESISGAGSIAIDGIGAEVVSWSENSVTMRVPVGDTDASNQTGGVPVSITRNDGVNRVVNVTFDNTDDSAEGTEQPTGYSAANVTNDNGNVISMSFNASSDDPSGVHNEEVMMYRIYRYEGNGPDNGTLPVGAGDFVRIAEIDATEAASYSFVDSNVPQNGVNYTYYVTSVDKNGNEQLAITETNRSVAQAIDEIIDELELSLAPGDEVLGVSWDHNNEGGDVVYTICYAEDSDLLQGDYTELAGRDGVTCVQTNGSSVNFEDLINGNRYYVRGYAEDGEGNVSVTDIYYADLLANLPESSIVGDVIANMPGSVRLFGAMVLLALVVSFANMIVIKNRVQKAGARS